MSDLIDLLDLLDPILDDPADPDMALPLPAESSGPAATTPTSQAPVVQPTTAPVVASSAAATTPPVQSSAAPVPEPVASSVAPSSAPAPVVSSQAPSSAAAVTSSSAPPVVIPSSTVTSTSTSTSASPSPSAAQSSASAVNNTSTVYVTASRSQPGLLNPSRVSSATGSSTALPASDKGGIGGSGLPLGGLVGIIIGGLAVIALIGLLVTRSMRKRARAKRTAHRSSMFEPWPAPVAMEDEPYEKPQSYPMHDNVAETYTDHNYANNYPEQGAYPGAMGYNDYPPQQYAAATAPLHPYPGQTGYSAEGTPYGGDIGAMGAAGVAGTGVAAAGSAAAAHGLQDGSMVRVKVGFVRSLEDELAITPGQQLYLHQAYDDGWSLCEDQAQNRGVVPISCLEPWDESSAAPVPSGNEQLASTGQRRSSLYRPNSGSY